MKKINNFGREIQKEGWLKSAKFEIFVQSFHIAWKAANCSTAKSLGTWLVVRIQI